MGAVAIARETQAPQGAYAQGDHLARNMALYRDIVVEHVRSNPTGPGAVPDAVLTFPDWYVRNPAWSNEVLPDGTVVVFASTRVSATLTTDLAELSQGSILVGEARHRAGGGTFLYSARYGDTAIELPDLDDGTPVWLASVK